MTETETLVSSLEVEFPYPETITARGHRKYKEPSGDLHLLVRRPAVEECFCIEHGPSAELAYMRHVYKKDEILYDKLQRTRKIMAHRAKSIIDHICPDIDAKMDVLYAVDYSKRGHDTSRYKPMAPASDSKVGTPIRPLKYEMQENVSMNPDFYPHLPKLRKIVAPQRPLQYGVTPSTISSFYPPHERGNTEYEVAYSIPGMAIMRSARRYLEPQPSTRRRANDFHH